MSLCRDFLFPEGILGRERVQGNDRAAQIPRRLGKAISSLASFTAEQLILELGKNVLPEGPLVRVKSGDSLDQPQGQPLIDVAIIQPGRLQKGIVGADDRINTPQVRFHDLISLLHSFIDTHDDSPFQILSVRIWTARTWG